ncbi:MAG: CBS domain-containing protein [Gammaproteobacteria bacterium]|nr:CBS domain-containing protein [Gammaproteobacteria bacterium]
MIQRQLIHVRDVMSKTVNFVDGIDTVNNAIETMKKERTEALIIRKRNEDDEYGIVVLADIADQVLAKDRSPERVNVYEIMSKPVISVDSGMDIRYCARLFSRFSIHLAPVIDKAEIVGIVSYNNLVLRGCDLARM